MIVNTLLYKIPHQAQPANFITEKIMPAMVAEIGMVMIHAHTML